MLNKLLKYDLKDMLKYFIPITFFLIAYTIFGRLFINYPTFIEGTNNQYGLQVLLYGLGIGVYIVLLVAYGLLSLALIITNFYKKMISSQGYLTHTLPVKTSTIFTSKVFSSFILLLSAFLIEFICIYVFFDIGHFLSIADIHIMSALKDIPGWNAGYIFIFILYVIFAVTSTITMFFLSMALGQLFAQHKIVGSIVSYIGIYFIYQIFGVIINVAVIFPMQIYERDINSITECLPFFLFGLVFAVALTLVQWLLSLHIFKNKLNLQ